MPEASRGHLHIAQLEKFWRVKKGLSTAFRTWEVWLNLDLAWHSVPSVRCCFLRAFIVSLSTKSRQTLSHACLERPLPRSRLLRAELANSLLLGISLFSTLFSHVISPAPGICCSFCVECLPSRPSRGCLSLSLFTLGLTEAALTTLLETASPLPICVLTLNESSGNVLSILWLNSIPLCLCTTSSLSDHLLEDTWVVSMF